MSILWHVEIKFSVGMWYMCGRRMINNAVYQGPLWSPFSLSLQTKHGHGRKCRTQPIWTERLRLREVFSNFDELRFCILVHGMTTLGVQLHWQTETLHAIAEVHYQWRMLYFVVPSDMLVDSESAQFWRQCADGERVLSCSSESFKSQLRLRLSTTHVCDDVTLSTSAKMHHSPQITELTK